MPKILINETSVARNPETLGTDIPYIPGFMGCDTTNTQKTVSPKLSAPVLFTSVKEFENNIGKYPYKFTSNQSRHIGTNTYEVVKSGSYDRSYIMAKELLNAGMPVYYQAFSAKSDEYPNIVPIIDSLRHGATTSDVSISTTCFEMGSTSGTFNMNFNTSFNSNETFFMEAEDATGAKYTIKFSDDVATQDADTNIYKVGTSGIATDDVLVFTLTKEDSEPDSDVSTPAVITLTCGKLEIVTSGTIIDNFYHDVEAAFGKRSAIYTDDLSTVDITDVGEYTIKYLTTGGYPNVFHTTVSGITTSDFTLADRLVELAAYRGDVVALVEGLSDRLQPLTGSNSFYNQLKARCVTPSTEGAPNHLNEAGDYGTAFYPWATHTLTKTFLDQKTSLMPAAYNYLISLAKSIKNNPNWLAIAGIGRGYISTTNDENIYLDNRLSNVIANSYQPQGTDGVSTIAINPITNIRPYGQTVWGNRTLKLIDKDSLENGTYFLNTRNMISDIKKVCYSAAKSLMFEQNSSIVWLEFKGKISPYLERLKAGNGISGYSLVKLESVAERFSCALHIYPVDAIESFEITIFVDDNDVNVNE